MKRITHHHLKSSAGEQIFRGSFVEKLRAAGVFLTRPHITTSPFHHNPTPHSQYLTFTLASQHHFLTLTWTSQYHQHHQLTFTLKPQHHIPINITALQPHIHYNMITSPPHIHTTPSLHSHLNISISQFTNFMHWCRVTWFRCRASCMPATIVTFRMSISRGLWGGVGRANDVYLHLRSYITPHYYTSYCACMHAYATLCCTFSCTCTHTHTCSEQPLRILMWNASYVQKHSHYTWQDWVDELTRERVNKETISVAQARCKLDFPSRLRKPYRLRSDIKKDFQSWSLVWKLLEKRHAGSRLSR